MNATVKYCLLLFTPFFLSANLAVADDSVMAINQIQYFQSNKTGIDPTAALDIAIHRFQQGKTETLQGNIFNQGLNQSFYWLKLDISENTHLNNAVRLVTNVAYRPLITAYLVENGSYTKILQSTASDTFSDRSHAFRLLNSTPFIIKPPGAFILIQYQVIGSSILQLQLLDNSQFTQLQLDDSSQSTMFYSFSFASIVIFMLFSAAMQEKISLYYSLLFSIALLFIATIDGFAFKYFWPSLPGWNHYSPLLLLYLLSAAGFYLAGIANQTTRHHQLFRKVMIGLTTISLLLAASCTLFDFVLLAKSANVLLALMFIAQTMSIASWVKTGPQYNKVTLCVAMPLTLSVVFLVFLSFNSTLLPGFIYFSSNRIVYLIASLVTMSVIILHVAHLKKSHQQSLARELELSRRDAERNNALFQAQQNFNRAQSLATLRQQQLASASHDMKQPLVSLRSTIDAAMQDAAPAIQQQLHNALDYLNNLCNQHLQQTNPDNAQSTAQTNDAESSTDEPYSLQLLFDTVIRMFTAEAVEKNIELRCQPSTVITSQPATVIMRILSNLIGNAIKHSKDAKILLGVRRRGNMLILQVHDTGPGMNEEQLQQLSQAYRKGPDSNGHGLGLAICQQLAEQHGMQLEVRSILGRGTSCCLQISRIMQ